MVEKKWAPNWGFKGRGGEWRMVGAALLPLVSANQTLWPKPTTHGDCGKWCAVYFSLLVTCWNWYKLEDVIGEVRYPKSAKTTGRIYLAELENHMNSDNAKCVCVCENENFWYFWNWLPFLSPLFRDLANEKKSEISLK